MTTEQEHKLRKTPGGLINHLIDKCPSCGAFNLWTKYQEVRGEMYYFQKCNTCGHVES